MSKYKLHGLYSQRDLLENDFAAAVVSNGGVDNGYSRNITNLRVEMYRVTDEIKKLESEEVDAGWKRAIFP
jgi:hypothetical protein